MVSCAACSCDIFTIYSAIAAMVTNSILAATSHACSMFDVVECLWSTFVTCLVQQFLWYLMSIAWTSLLSTAVESLICNFSSPSFFTAASRELPADNVLTVCSGWGYPPSQSQKKHTSWLYGDVFERVSGCLASSDKSHDFHLASFGPHSSVSYLSLALFIMPECVVSWWQVLCHDTSSSNGKPFKKDRTSANFTSP